LELSPEHFRSFVVGTSYQLGNLVSSASATIEATTGERFPLPPLSNGVTRYDYGKVMAIFMGCVFAYGIENYSTFVLLIDSHFDGYDWS